MITEEQQERASLYALGILPADEVSAFEAEVRASSALREVLRELQQATVRLALELPRVAPPPELKSRLMARLAATQGPVPSEPPPVAPAPLPSPESALRFLKGAAQREWKPLPLPGAYIKVLSHQPDRGYAVLLGRLDPGVRYPAHTNAGPEDFLILSGDLQVSGNHLTAGDFHHADAGSFHEENYSIEGCTLLAVLTTDDPLVAMALG
jgi:anti-sigma factor ChrR (cupin superfamily)